MLDMRRLQSATVVYSFTSNATKISTAIENAVDVCDCNVFLSFISSHVAYRKRNTPFGASDDEFDLSVERDCYSTKTARYLDLNPTSM